MEQTKKTYPDDAVPLFLSFCIEQYKQTKGVSGAEAMEELSAFGTLEYLKENYEVIHTQSPQWIIEEIEEFIIKHKK